MSSFKSSDSPQLKLIYEWGQGFEKKDAKILAKYLHKDFRHVTYPRSLNLPEKNREEWLEHISKVFSLWAETEHISHSITEAPGKVIYHFTQKTKTTVGVNMPYEAITITHIVTDGDGSLKITKIEDFIDSKSHLEAMQALAEVQVK